MQDVHTMNIYELSGTEHDDNYNLTSQPGDCSATLVLACDKNGQQGKL